MKLTAGLVVAGAFLLLASSAFAQTARRDVILGGSESHVIYHAESAPTRPDGLSRIIGGNIHIVSDRGADDGIAGPCDPDPRPDPHTRPDDLPLSENCAWAQPQGVGEDFIAFGRHIQEDFPEESGGVARDTDFSPTNFYPWSFTDTRESFNGRGGFDRGNRLFVDDRPVLDDEDVNIRVRSTGIDNYVAPQGNPNNRWRRLCGTGIVEALDGNETIPAGFFAGQVVKFVVQIWDADWQNPSDQDGGNEDYFIIDLFDGATTFNTASCVAAAGTTPTQPGTTVVPEPGQPLAPQAPGAPPVIDVAGEQVVQGTARVTGPRRCVNRPFNVTISGRQIRRVVFSVDGRRIDTVSSPNARGQWITRINPRRFARGVRRVTARVTFVRGAGRTRTLRVAFQRCPRPAQRVAPRFTG